MGSVDAMCSARPRLEDKCQLTVPVFLNECRVTDPMKENGLLELAYASPKWA